jgi:hypothetical protein
VPLQLPDFAQGVILPAYTDERLRAEAASDKPGVRRRAELLLKVPAEQRQNIEAEVTRRSSRSVTRMTPGGQAQSVSMATASNEAAREALVATYLLTENQRDMLAYLATVDGATVDEMQMNRFRDKTTARLAHSAHALVAAGLVEQGSPDFYLAVYRITDLGRTCARAA